MAQVDRSLVADLPVFAGFSPADLDGLLREAQATRYPKGAVVFQQDEEAHSFFVLLHGHLRAFKYTPDGQQVVVRFIMPGELFGVAMAVGWSTYPASATAVVDSIALSWPTSTWPRLAANHPFFAATTLQAVGARLHDAHTRLIEVSTQQVERRVAHALLRLAQQAGAKGEKGVQIAFPLTRQDIAEMTGTTLHTVSRVLSAWEDQGLVESARQRITLRDPHRLFLLAQPPV